ncbi:MAG: hypothetical protein LBK75_01225 [Oscillospiraceae bacterium]|jgi:hypothetical protein|nr:hypothetical protein [Oscillospiraceae bacterium]
MVWFVDWWAGLGVLGQVLACAALPATAVMVIQTVLLLGGAFWGDGDADGDTDADADFDMADDADGDFDGDAAEHGVLHADDGLRVFTVRGIVAFLAVGGWTGIALLRTGEMTALLGAIAAGTAALLFAALVIRWVLKLQGNGNIVVSNALEHMATVYIPIPPARVATGRVTMLLQGRFTELDAVTDDETPLKTGESVRVVGVLGENCLVVSKVEVKQDYAG